MKKLQNLKGAKVLGKSEQQYVKGGKADLCRYIQCVPEDKCINGRCVPRTNI